MLKISKKSLIAFYNLANIKYRIQILFKGRFPQSDDLPYNWLNTNVLFLSVKDFENFCKESNFRINKQIYIKNTKKIKFFPNNRAELCIIEVSKIESEL